jgi:hypothetical protein
MTHPFKLSPATDTPRSRKLTALVAVNVLLALALLSARAEITAVSGPTGPPTATLSAAPALRLAGDVDSNSPAVWDLVEGRALLHVLTSTAGQPSIASGRFIARLGEAAAVGFVTHPGHGVWMEAVVADESGTWYGYYHNEIPALLCNRPDRVLPRIGAARSRDRGQTWEDLGIILEAPPGWHSCGTRNSYFVGGVGDFSVMLDPNATDLYVFFSQYSLPRQMQGVAVARLLWASRDQPQGAVSVWADGVWQPASSQPIDPDDATSEFQWTYPAGTSLLPVRHAWHDLEPLNDAFWGPSVHWNTYLRQYVMLLNRAKDDDWQQEGIYISFAPSLQNPAAWSPPQRVLAGGSWYPQVIGLEFGSGTDKTAAKRARLFVSGASDHFIEFQRAGGS